MNWLHGEASVLESGALFDVLFYLKECQDAKESDERRSENRAATTPSVTDTRNESLAIEDAQRKDAKKTINSVQDAVLAGKMGLAYGYRFHARFFARPVPNDVR